MKQIKYLRFTGMQRSGNHAIIKWVWYNFCQSQMQRIYSINDISIFHDLSQQIFFINNCQNPNQENQYIQYIINTYTDTRTIFLSYENKQYVTTNSSYLIIRDFLNMLSSKVEQVKKYHHNPSSLLNEPGFYAQLIDMWIQHAQFIEANNIILYNKWILDKNYRDHISNFLYHINNLDYLDYYQAFGGGSSFIGRQKETNLESYLCRYQNLKLPQTIKNMILNNKNLCQINLEYFNINIEECFAYD
jgi:hypothetical protein